MNTWRVAPGGPLRGEARLPGDKSISHRALLLGALAAGKTRVRGLLQAEDVASTARCLRALGAGIDPGAAEGELIVSGLAGALQEPADALDCGNAGTALRLLCGLLAGQPLFAVLTGDASLRGRPMGRVTAPLRALGARIDGRGGGDRAPLAVRGGALRNGPVASAVASAQVKSALLLAGLQGEGTLVFREPHPTRDHTERMLRGFGAALDTPGDSTFGQAPGEVRLEGGQRLQGADIEVPGDFSSAAFLIVAATVVPGSDVLLRGVGLNPTRTGLLIVLRRMGADIDVCDERLVGGEPRGDLRVRAAPLRGTTVGGAEIPGLIDELPVLAVAAALATGETVISGAGELRVKESDRIATTTAMLRALGADVEAQADGFLIAGQARLAGGVVDPAGDHRVALAGAVAALAALSPSTIKDSGCIGVSFPTFPALLAHLRGGE